MSSGAKELNERKKLILKAIVDAHIANGEPVGSKFLTQNKQIACSSATIRNEMAELEEMGYLEQPHTSAGRVPSEAGYRFYVDQLLDLYHLTEQEIRTLREGLRQKQQELDGIMQTAVTLAARLTNYTALSLRPRQPRVTVQRFEIMRIDDHTAVLIMLIGSIVKTKYIRSTSPISLDATVRLAAALNLKLTGITAAEITLPLMMEMERMMGEYDYLVAPVVKSVCEVISLFDGGELRFEGIDRLLAYPDYYDLGRLRELLALFEKKEDLLEVLSEEAQHDDDRLQIYIGSENLVKVMDNSTLIFQTIRQNGKPVGAIGIIGPTRMDYRKVIATVSSLSSGITEALDRPHGDRNSG